MAKKNDGYIRFRCRNCDKRLKVKDTVEGGNVISCPSCGAAVTVPMANLEAIAEGTAMEETGLPGRLNVDPELLRKRLSGEDEARSGPGSVGGPPTLHQGEWNPMSAFGRIVELDQLAAAIIKVNDDMMGQVQRLFRKADQSPEDREQEVKVAAERRQDELRKLFESRLLTVRHRAHRLQAMEHRLSRAEMDDLVRSKAAAEALELYARYVYGIEV